MDMRVSPLPWRVRNNFYVHNAKNEFIGQFQRAGDAAHAVKSACVGEEAHIPVELLELLKEFQHTRKVNLHIREANLALLEYVNTKLMPEKVIA